MYVGWLFQILLNRNISLKCVGLRAGSSYGFGDIVWAKKNKSLCNEADFTAQRLSFSLPKLQEYPPNPQGEPARRLEMRSLIPLGSCSMMLPGGLLDPVLI